MALALSPKETPGRKKMISAKETTRRQKKMSLAKETTGRLKKTEEQAPDATTTTPTASATQEASQNDVKVAPMSQHNDLNKKST